MHAFLTPPTLPTAQRAAAHRTTSPRRARPSPRRAHARAQASSRRPRTSSLLKERSVIALRFLSDLGGITILHELASRLTQHTQAGLVESELALGGLLGIWTAASFADRLRASRKSLIAESEGLPARWDSAVVYRPALDEDDVVAAVAWLFALDELEGVAAATLLRELATSDSILMRIRLSDALAEYPIRSNVCVSILHTLADDPDPHVRSAATAALHVYETSGILLRTPPAAVPALAGAVATASEDEAELKGLLDRLFKEPGLPLPPVKDAPLDQGSLAWMRDFVSERVETMGTAAHTSPDLVSLRRHAVGLQPVEPPPVQATAASRRLEVPFFEGLKWSEMHGLVALALLPAGYELFSMIDGVDLPLRFVGLGWLLTLGGLVAYPQSANLWRRIRKMLDSGVIS